MGLGINDHIKSLQGCLFLRSVDKTRSSYWPQGCQCILRAEVAKGAVFCFGVSDWKGCVMSRPACPVHLMCDKCVQSPSLPVSPALCAIVATIWFPVCAHREITIVSFGYSLYTGWIGAVMCLVGGCVIVCCSGDAQSFGENRFYYSSGSSSPTHAKSAHV